MASKEEMRANAARLAAVDTPKARKSDDAAASASPSRKPGPRAKPVRITVDLAPNSYSALQDYTRDLARSLGEPRLPMAEVLRATIDAIGADPAFRKTLDQAVSQRHQAK